MLACAGCSSGELSLGGFPGAASEPGPMDTFPVPLVHRYSFEGQGSVAEDSIGSAHGAIVGASLDGSGALTLDQLNGEQYVDLPNGLLSKFDEVTIEAWFTWTGSGSWERVFDFGASSGGEDAPVAGTVHFSLALAPEFVRLVFDVDAETGSRGWRAMWVPRGLMDGARHHVAAVFQARAAERRLSLYVDGVLGETQVVPLTETLSAVEDVNNWFGRAQWDADPEFHGSLDEVRIYAGAREPEAIAASVARGPDMP